MEPHGICATQTNSGQPHAAVKSIEWLDRLTFADARAAFDRLVNPRCGAMGWICTQKLGRGGKEGPSIRDALNEVHARVCGFQADRFNRLIGRRLVPRLRLLDGVESNHGHSPFGSVSFEGRHFTAVDE